jgi:hypothetical protein
VVHPPGEWVTAAGALAPEETNKVTATTKLAGGAHLDALVPSLRALEATETCGRHPPVGRKSA